MADSIKATPRGKIAGALSDAFSAVDDFAGNPFGYQNPPGRMLSSMAGLPDIAKTLDRLSYGEPLVTGAGMTTRPRDEAINTAMAVAPWAGPTARGLAAAPRTARNVGRVVKGTDPLEAALSEIVRVKSPVERAAASSPRGWVGPVEVGDMGSVSVPRSSRFAPASSVTHTHPRTSEFGSYSPLSPSDVPRLKGRNVDMNVVHTVRETGVPSRYRETLKAGSLPPELIDGESVLDYVNRLNATPGYSSNVPAYLRPEGAIRAADYAGGGLSVVKLPSGNWLSGSVEDALRGLKPRIRTEGINGHTAQDAFADQALNQFVDKQLTRYIRNDMATERDPIRALAERGVLHFDPPSMPRDIGKVWSKREELGYPRSAGASPLAQKWEAYSDQVINAPKVENYQNFGSSNMTGKPGWEWVEKADPESRIYAINKPSSYRADEEGFGTLGFEHLMDELRNAVDINSGLPAHLRLDPESLARVSVPQAVERVAKINDWRAAQKAAADQALANNAATVLHKDYPDKGFKWMELKRPDKAPEGWAQVVKSGEKPNLDRDYAYGMEALRDALKYEGDTMGHCVGGYCDDVASGKSRIYSLRDAKGQPHTTIEVVPKGAVFSDVAKHIGSERADELLDQGVTLSEMIKGIPDFQYPQAIKQIKGKANKAPNPEYLPFVQDFVKSGKWSDVGDLGNTGLKSRSAMFDRRALEKPEISSLPEYFTQDELEAAQKAYAAKLRGEPGFAGGGSVRGAINAAVGSSNLAKQVGSSADAVRSIAAGNGSLSDLNSLRQMASELGYTAPGLSQVMGLAATANAGYNMAKDPTGTNAAKFAAKVNPIAAQALSLYNMATDATPQDAANFIVGFHPMLQAYNGLADTFGFANIGQLAANLTKIGDPEAPAQLRDAFSNNPNSDALARTVNDIVQRTGADPMDTLMSITGAFGTEPGYTGYYSRVGGGDTSSVSSSGRSFPSYSGGDRTDARNNGSPSGVGGIGIG